MESPEVAGSRTASRKQGHEMPRIGGTRSVAALLPRVTRQALGRRGFAEAGVITEWAAIVGADLAALASPVRINHKRGRGRPGTLEVRAASAAATELAHRETQILERVNGFFGYAAVDRLAIVHRPAPRPPARPRPPAAEPAAAAPASPQLDAIEDDALRTALHRLGGALRRAPNTRGRG